MLKPGVRDATKKPKKGSWGNSKGSYIFGSNSACLEHEASRYGYAIRADNVNLCKTKIPNSQNREVDLEVL